MIDIPLMSFVVAWIKHLFVQLRIWMIRRSFDAVKREIAIVNARHIIWKSEFHELKKRVEMEVAVSSALEDRLQAIQQDTSNPAKARLLHDETERLKDRRRWLRQRLVCLLKDRKTIVSMRKEQIFMLGVLEQTLNRWLLVNTTVYTSFLFFTDHHE
ncbi:hypothetical protein N7491_005831 [Penicillium cf. griseofulvum]|uniref:Uncharacterized protein n=1 Tax=Penicillium cf. griseofulvum TaxID=2972120 RepID=A0A9W9J5C5_9EURO|nr:hypothetical protein N7472_008515 [Penicillium cf. griseofulvum]KAJ5435236.1 hypothetical protein N7491_005831 [Penicillium cf. griseofulvum]KAJ5453069.1 hypothetical protein N7445_001252 [Penicillium cf. griseofulvum]